MKSTNNDLAQKEGEQCKEASTQCDMESQDRARLGVAQSLPSHLLLFWLSPLVSLNWMGISASLSYIFFLNQPLMDSDSIVNRVHNDYRSPLPPTMLLSYLGDF